jgi:hypothetical protein
MFTTEHSRTRRKIKRKRGTYLFLAVWKFLAKKSERGKASRDVERIKQVDFQMSVFQKIV